MEVVLNCCSQATCEVPFNYPLTSFQGDDGKFKQYCIVNGECTVLIDDSPSNADKQDYDDVITVTAHEIEPKSDNEELNKKLRKIFKSIIQGGKNYYPENSVKLTLVFADTPNGLILLDKSSGELTDKKENEEEEDKNENSNEEDENNKKENEEEEEKHENNNDNDRNEEEEEEEKVTVAEYIAQCVSEKPNPHKCCSGLKHCPTKATYVVPRYLVVLKKVMDKFPNENPASLKRLVKVALEDPEEPCYACVSCNSDYLAVERIADCAKIEAEPKLGLPPRNFQPLSQEELWNKKRYPVGIGRGMNKPYSFSLNLQNSPYGNVPMPRAPPKPPSKTRASSATTGHRTPAWTKRLTSRDPQQSQRSSRPGTALRPPERPMDWPPYKDPVPISQKLARKIYKAPALPIYLMEKKRRHRFPPKEHPEGDFNPYIPQKDLYSN